MGRTTKETTRAHEEMDDTLREKMGQRISDWLNEKGLTRKQLARELKVEEKTMERVEANTGPVDLAMLKKLHEVTEISYSELIEGVPAAHKELHEATGLSAKAIQHLEQYNQSYPDYIKMLNGILEDNTIATLLLDTFLLYANYELLQIKVGEIDHEFPICLGSTQQQGLHRSLASYYLQTVLEKVRQDWQTNIGTVRMEQAVAKVLDSVKLSLAERLQRMDNYKRYVDKQIYEAERRDNGED